MSIDKTRLDLCREYFANPGGPHSPELQHLLLLLRADTVNDPHMLVQTGPQEWTLGMVEPRRGTDITLLPDFCYISYEDGQRAQFALRWRMLTGDTLPFGPPLPDDEARHTTFVNRRITGYAEPWEASTGDAVALKINPLENGPVTIDVLRMRCGFDDPPDYVLALEPADCSAAGIYEVARKTTQVGSHVVVDPAPPSPTSGCTIRALVCPARGMAGAPQAVLSTWNAERQRGWSLHLDADGCAALTSGDGSASAVLSTGVPLKPECWYAVTASIGRDGSASIRHVALSSSSPAPDTAHAQATMPLPTADGGALLIGAWAQDEETAAAHFNGKIEAPALFNGVYEQDGLPDEKGVLARWDFSIGIGTETVHDAGPHGCHGKLVNHPTRAVTGSAWDGSEHNWRHKPDHYAAMRFHDDALTDCRWPEDVALKIPDDWRDGIYTARLTQGDDCGWIPFFVTARPGKPKSRLAVLLPTATYIAYANDGSAVSHASMLERTMNCFAGLTRSQAMVHEHLELGASTYDLHSDGRGVSMASRLRPVLCMAPNESVWNFGADTLIIDWLDARGIDHDIITDEQLHRHGTSLLEGYACVLTGTHPEYTSLEMMRALMDWRDAGGRLIYLGGNGFYWRIAWSDERPGVIEIRRAEDGARNWIAETGEYHLSLTGELSGLWRRNGIPPQKLGGVGTTGFGFDSATWYDRTEASFDPRAAWIFDGVGTDERIGDFGAHRGGAAGTEVDRADVTLGTPDHTLVLATARNFPPSYTTTPEDVLHQTGSVTGDTSSLVRADMVFFEAPNGGAVFATGSIAWADALSHNAYDNNVSRITENVIRRFLDPDPF